MTLPSVVRLFFAVDLSTQAKVEIGHLISLLKRKAKSNAIRWSKPDNLHITLQFLAEVRREDLSTLIENVREQIKGKVNEFSLTFDTCYLFPSPYRPRVIVLNIIANETLTRLSELIGDGIKRLNYELENRPFRPHLTLGRIKHPHGVNLSFLSTFQVLGITNMDIHEVVLFRSAPRPEGSIYTPLERIALVSGTQ